MPTRKAAGEKAPAVASAEVGAAPASWTRRLFAPVDIASIALFRVVFGALMLWEVWYYASNGFIDQFWGAPDFHFKYHGFEWVKAWPGQGMQWHFALLGLCALGILLGAFYRLAAALFCVGITYVFLIEQARYLNHFYLTCLLSLLLACIPAHRSLSLDARRRPALRSDTVPAWTLWLLRAQFGLVYFYGGIAKLNGDWLRGEPMRAFLAQHADSKLLGAHAESAWLTLSMAYGGLLLDLSIVPLLLWKRTRKWAFLCALLFHLANSWLFTLDIFPWLMIAATALFFPPDWPRRIFAPRPLATEEPPSLPPRSPWRERAVLGGLAVYLGIQVLAPLRQFLYPGNTLWTEEGQRFAWRMMLRDKRGETWFAVDDLDRNQHGYVDPRLFMSAEESLAMYHDPAAMQKFAGMLMHDWAPKQGFRRVSVKAIDSFLRFYVVKEPGGARELVQTPQYLTLYQQDKMVWYPDFILQFAHRLRDEHRRAGAAHVQVFTEAWVSLNGRRHQLIVDPEVDLAAEERSLAPASWIRPLTEPLRR